jgi:hypothetical protein
VATYADKATATEAHLLVFDRTAEKPATERLFHRQVQHDGYTVNVWGM